MVIDMTKMIRKFQSEQQPDSWFTALEENGMLGNNLRSGWIDTLMDRTLDYQQKYKLSRSELDVLRKKVSQQSGINY